MIGYTNIVHLLYSLDLTQKNTEDLSHEKKKKQPDTEQHIKHIEIKEASCHS